MAVAVYIGFAPTFYSRLFSVSLTTVSGAPFTPLVYFHGALFTLWVLFFLTQTSLVAGRRVATHRKLGVAGVGLALVMVVVGVMTAIAAAARGSAPPGADPLAFLTIPLGDMAVFAPLVAAAVWLRKKKEAHKRLMLLASICLLTAAIARWPGMLSRGPLAFFALTDLFIVAGVVFDLATRRRVHAAYVWGGLFLVASQPLRLMISGTEAWQAFARFLVR